MNVVATMDWRGPTFEQLRRHLLETGIAYEGRSPWIQCRFQPANYYVAFYKGGRFLHTGAKSIELARDRLASVTRQLEDGLPNFLGSNFQVKNLVLTGQVKLKIALDTLVQRLPATFEASFEPEQFPGMELHFGGATVLLYANGSFVLTGLRELSSAQARLIDLQNQLHACSAG